MELNTSYSQYELSWVEAADFGLEPAMNIKEELMKDLTGAPAVAVNSVILEQLVGDYEVVEMQADPKEEEEQKNNISCVECSNKKQEVSTVDQVVTTNTGDMAAALSSSLTADSKESLWNLGVEEVTELNPQLFVPTINYLSPVKKVSSPTPRKKTVSSKTPTSGKRIIMLVSDDKENIEKSGTMITTAAEEENEKKGICMEKYERGCWDETTSLRKLKKELKAKLEEKVNNKNIKVHTIIYNTNNSFFLLLLYVFFP